MVSRRSDFYTKFLAFQFYISQSESLIAGWSSPVARQAHNLKVAGSNPAPATNFSGRMDGCFGAYGGSAKADLFPIVAQTGSDGPPTVS